MNPQPSPDTHSTPKHFLWLVTAVCLALSIWMTWPVWWAKEPSLVGHWDALDLPGSAWAHWWVADTLAKGASPFVDTVSFYPFGLNPVLQYNLLDAVVGAPWVWLAGVRVGYNLATVTALTTTGLAAYALARNSGLMRAGALFAAVTIQSSSAVAVELYEGRISQVLLAFFLLSLAALMQIMRREPTVRMATGLGLAAAATALVYWYSGLFLLLTAAIVLWAHSDKLNGNRWKMLGLSAVVGLGITLPFAIDLIQQWDALPGITGGTDLNKRLNEGRGIAIENSRWPLWPLYGRANQEAGHQIGILTLVLTGLAVRWKLPNKKVWLGVAGLGWLMAMGPVVHGYSSATTIGLPFGWMQDHFPTFSRMWWPKRFEILTAIGLSLIAGLALDRFLNDRSRPRWWVFAALLLSVIDAPIRSGVIPVRASPVPQTTEALYEGLDGALLTTPVFPDVNILNRLRWIQTIHGLPIQNGNGEHISGHRPPGYTEWIEANKVLSALDGLHRKGSMNARIEPADVQDLLDSGFRYAVADPAAYWDGTGRNWTVTHGRFFEQLWGRPIRLIKGAAVWKITAIEQGIDVEAKYAQGNARQLRR
jgi:hypothetical protein